MDSAAMSRLKATLILIGAIGGTIAFAAWFHSRIVPEAAGTVHSGRGTAWILGLVFSLMVGAGLVLLMFVSNRHGYDSNAGRRQDAPPSEFRSRPRDPNAAPKRQAACRNRIWMQGQGS